MNNCCIYKYVIAFYLCLNTTPMFAQPPTISLNKNRVKLEQIIDDIEKQSEYLFIYSNDINVKKKYSLNIVGNDIYKILFALFEGTKINYDIERNYIFLYTTKREIFNLPANNTKEIKGTISNMFGEPLMASIWEKGTTRGVVTDSLGNFAITVSENAMLEISSIGYLRQNATINDRNEMYIVMSEDYFQLDEVVVIGYGTMKLRQVTGSIALIRPERYENESPATIQDILRNSTPGLNVDITNNAKGGGNLHIRGKRSLSASNSPLIVVDNMIFFGELSEINPQDIEQIDVLKDASSAAIFGAKSANGVIIITTKTGKTGKPVVRFNASVGIVTMGANRKIYDANDYLKFRADVLDSKSGFTSGGIYAQPTPQNLASYGITLDEWRGSSTGSNDEIWLDRLGLFDKEKENYYAGKTFDWYNYTFQTGLRQDYNVSLSGKSDKINYYMSLGYYNSKGIIVGDDYKTIRSNLKIDGKVNKFLNIGVNINFQNRTDSNLANTQWENQLISNSPYALPWDNKGNLVLKPMGTNSLNEGYNYAFDRQYQELERGYTVLNSTLTAKIDLPFNITYTLNFAPRFQWYYNRYHASSEHPTWSSSHNGLVNRGQTKWFNWLFNNTINWEYTFADSHNINVTLSQEAEEHFKWSDAISASDFMTDALGIHDVEGANKMKSSFSNEDTHNTGDALLARLFYSYDNRYMTTLSVRRDGYSAFGMDNPRAVFASVAFAWNFTNENFFKCDAMSSGKLRLSWGSNGNRSIGMYTALSNLTGGSGTYAYVDSSNSLVEMNQLYVSRMANHKLRWEKTSSWNIGLDFGFFNNLVNGTIEYYYMPTTDLIVNQSLPNVTGFDNVTTNLGEVVNKGIEISLNTTNIRSENLTWNTSFGFSHNHNEIKHLYYTYMNLYDSQGSIVGTKEKDDPANGWFIGENIDVIWNYKLLGIWQLNETEEAAKYGQVAGDPKVKDKYNVENRTYSDEDKEFLGQTIPKFRFFLRNEFNLFKNFAVSVNIYSYWGHKAASTDYLNSGYMYERANTYIRKYWTPENPTNKFARLGPSTKATGAPRIIDKSFIRLESISLAYNIPKKYLSKLEISSLKFFGSIRNVAVWSKEWYIWDPETTSTMPRIYTVGMDLLF